MEAAAPFRAFVSYCHADAAFAAWLQRRLETYRLPRRLADRVAPLAGQAQGRIGPVFRDRADLSAAEDLSAAVREAIARSSALVVIASPEAVRSQWVAREIALFQNLHPSSPILVALARGEPGEALPPALLYEGVEPLAADFRKEGDGRRLAFLKIVAGLAGLPLDALVQRDAQRQLRRVTVVTLGAVILMVIMALLLVTALRAREEADRRRVEAERQRTEAEGLVEYMLTDLRAGLEGVGRLELMDAVNARAMVYYTHQGDLRLLPDDSLERRARVLQAMGADLEKRNRLGDALAKFAEAHRTTAAILARRPTDPDRIFAHAQSEYYLGLIAWRQDKRAEAERYWQAYRRQATALAEAEPLSGRGLMEEGYAEGNLCELNLQDKHDLAAAERQCLSAIRFMQAALEKAPADRSTMMALANRHGWLARVRMAAARPAAALSSRDSEAALMDRLLAADPSNVEYAVRRLWADIGKADALIQLGRAGEAETLLAASARRHAPVFASNDGDARVIETEFRLRLFLAEAQRLRGESSAAALARAARLQAALGASGPESADRAQKIRAAIWGQGRKVK
jgi:hypothetical protein